MDNPSSPSSSLGAPPEELFRCRARNPRSACNQPMTASELQEHYRILHPECSLVCLVDGCEFFRKKLSTAHAKKSHYVSKHPNFVAGGFARWYCTACTYSSTRKGNSLTHLKTHMHPDHRTTPSQPRRRARKSIFRSASDIGSWRWADRLDISEQQAPFATFNSSTAQLVYSIESSPPYSVLGWHLPPRRLPIRPAQNSTATSLPFAGEQNTREQSSTSCEDPLDSPILNAHNTPLKYHDMFIVSSQNNTQENTMIADTQTFPPTSQTLDALPREDQREDN